MYWSLLRRKIIERNESSILKFDILKIFTNVRIKYEHLKQAAEIRQMSNQPLNESNTIQ